MSDGVSTTERQDRRGELDVMGMLVVVGLIFFHTAQIFYIGDFYVKNEPPGMAALIFIVFASLWGMPIMFLIAGMAVRYSLLKRTAGEFVGSACKVCQGVDQLPIVIIGFYVVKWEIHALFKYILISFGSLTATLVLYDICVRRTNITRIIFGIKQEKNRRKLMPVVNFENMSTI